MIINMKDFEPLSSHQVGIKIKNIIINTLNMNNDLIVLDFDNVDVCTDSFSQQLTTVLAQEIPFVKWKDRIKYRNLNKFLLEIIKGKLHQASQLS